MNFLTHYSKAQPRPHPPISGRQNAAIDERIRTLLKHIFENLTGLFVIVLIVIVLNAGIRIYERFNEQSTEYGKVKLELIFIATKNYTYTHCFVGEAS